MKLSISSLSFEKKRKIGRAAFAALLFLLLFFVIGQNLSSECVKKLDHWFYSSLIRHESPGLTGLMKGVSEVGSAMSVILMILALLPIWWLRVFLRGERPNLRNMKTWISIGSVTLFSSILNETLKRIYERPRPEILRLAEAHGFSFPSGHSMNGLVFFGLVGWYLYSYGNIEKKKYWIRFLAICLWFLVLLIGISRVYLGVHYASDVIGGFSFGAFLLNIIAMASIWYSSSETN